MELTARYSAVRDESSGMRRRSPSSCWDTPFRVSTLNTLALRVRVVKTYFAQGFRKLTSRGSRGSRSGSRADSECSDRLSTRRRRCGTSGLCLKNQWVERVSPEVVRGVGGGDRRRVIEPPGCHGEAATRCVAAYRNSRRSNFSAVVPSVVACMRNRYSSDKYCVSTRRRSVRFDSSLPVYSRHREFEVREFSIVGHRVPRILLRQLSGAARAVTGPPSAQWCTGRVDVGLGSATGSTARNARTRR